MLTFGKREPEGGVFLTAREAAWLDLLLKRLRTAQYTLTVPDRVALDEGYMARLPDQAAHAMAGLLKPHMLTAVSAHAPLPDASVHEFRLVAVVGGVPDTPAPGEVRDWLMGDPLHAAFGLPEGVGVLRGYSRAVQS